ncbi:thiamine diphosphokinase [Lachnotalea glycerini]|jgi:thiamine pyrophosphokinase|uniref:Thiamine diphosphokinase n=1 Tax=Lachnotalea glycerini TaxID=1763509 RepID=A0A255INH8_9FIRM|nr:thiamine diphosphokinase [Lachnotalea glycerini]PXV89511.1 thiamine diphosphokinase [Lachnotalea glycerini]RDY32307.1 thiamine diphosphokinase [Lachnotalea glycerini]
MKTLIISGGYINQEFLEEFLSKNKFEYIIGVDKGIEICYEYEIMPSIIMGDFDSVRMDTLKYYENHSDIKIHRFKPEKDDTDTQMAILWAVQIESTEIAIIGATGSRIDHLLGNIQSLSIALEKNINCYIIDSNNKIMLIKDSLEIKKKEQYGTYLSLLALTNQVTGLTLTGFKYPLYEYNLTNQSGGFGVSNEIVEERAKIMFQSGILIMIQSKD